MFAERVYSRYGDVGDMLGFELLPSCDVNHLPRLGSVLWDDASVPRRLRDFRRLEGRHPPVNGWRIKDVSLSDGFIIHRCDTLYIDASIHSAAGRGLRQEQIVEAFISSLTNSSHAFDLRYNAESALVLHNEGGGTWGHFLIQNIPKAALYLNSNPGGKIALPAAQCVPGISSFADALLLCGARPEQLLPLEPGVTYKFAELIIVDPPYDFDTALPHPFTIELLEGWRNVDQTTERQPLFIDRVGKPPARTIANLADLEPSLSKYDFRREPVGSLPLEKQISAWNKSSLAIGVLGSDFSNLVFLPRGADLLVISPDWFADAFFYHLAIMKGARWNELRCGAIGGEAEILHRSSFYVDPSLFSDFVEMLSDGDNASLAHASERLRVI